MIEMTTMRSLQYLAVFKSFIDDGNFFSFFLSSVVAFGRLCRIILLIVFLYINLYYISNTLPSRELVIGLKIH